MIVYRIEEPPLFVTVEPKAEADRERMDKALTRVVAEKEGSVLVETDFESGRTIMRVESELDLDALVSRMRREFGVEPRIGAPQVAYREAISHSVDYTYTLARQTGGRPQFAEVTLRIELGGPSDGCSFESRIADDALPAEYMPGIERGVRSVTSSGPLGGFPVIGVRITLTGGKHHPVDSSVLTFEIASRMCMREGLKRAGAMLLEPVMWVQVVTPGEHVGRIVGDLTSRRGVERWQGSRDSGSRVIHATVPLTNLFGYSASLADMTKGKAEFTSDYMHHSPVELPGPEPDDQFPGAMAMRA